jgi:alpha-aminoadipic semialdehyde synthase
MTKTVAIRHEDKNVWEKRVALTPEDMKSLIKPGIKFLVQPSDTRIFKDDEYAEVGAELTSEVTNADLLIAVKEIPMKFFRQGGSYMFFSHTIKAQPYNMPMLQKLVDLGCTLIDYECIIDDKCRRLVFFGKYAGLAGMIDTFHALGRRLETEGIKTAFSKVKMAYEYGTLENAKKELKEVALQLQEEGIPESLRPMVFGFTGYGNVSIGAQEIFDIFKFKQITPEQLADVDKLEVASDELVKVIFSEEHTVEPKDETQEFDKFDYFSHPEKYQSIFARNLDYLSVLVNCIFWSAKSPRLMTLEDTNRIYSADNPKLKVIGDISCDIEGGIECTLKATQPDNPIFVYDIDKKTDVDGVEGRGPVIMSVDNLPCELSKEASEAFSAALKPFMLSLINLDTNLKFEDADLPDPIRKAVILWNGEFTPDYKFMQAYLKS